MNIEILNEISTTKVAQFGSIFESGEDIMIVVYDEIFFLQSLIKKNKIKNLKNM